LTRSARYAAALALNLLLVAGLVAVGITAHSLALLAAGADYLADAAAIGVAMLALRLAGAHPKANAVAAAVNGGWLLVLSVLVVVGGVHRLVEGTPEVHGLPVLVVSAVAGGLMLVGALVLGRDADDGDEALSHRAVLLDTLADAAAAFGVAAAGAVILARGGWYWLDPAVAVAISLVIGWHAVALLREVRVALRLPGPLSRPDSLSP
jgi:cobalt-zinc-cadmium efflux system protein